MTPQQKSALETLLGDVMTPEQEAAIGPLVDVRNDTAVAAALSVGRMTIVSHMISERGVRAALSITDAYAFLEELKSASTAPPAWLSPTLLAMGVPVEQHPAYADALSSAWRWLTQDAGLDVGAGAVRGMLDLIAAGVPTLETACAAVKSLAERPAPIHVQSVSEALNNG